MVNSDILLGNIEIKLEQIENQLDDIKIRDIVHKEEFEQLKVLLDENLILLSWIKKGLKGVAALIIPLVPVGVIEIVKLIGV